MSEADITPAQVAEMRGWVSDCEWVEDPEDIAAMTDEQIIIGVANHYDGGIDQFVSDAGV